MRERNIVEVVEEQLAENLIEEKKIERQKFIRRNIMCVCVCVSLRGIPFVVTAAAAAVDAGPSSHCWW